MVHVDLKIALRDSAGQPLYPTIHELESDEQSTARPKDIGRKTLHLGLVDYTFRQQDDAKALCSQVVTHPNSA
jgi:hypothetical protein